MTAALKLDHLAIPIFKVEESHAFYTTTLGLPLLAAHTGDDWGGFPWLMMIFGLGDARQLALIALRGAEPPAKGTLPDDAHHVAFAMDSEAELASWKAKLQERHVAFTEEDHGTQRSLYFKDPNQIVLELTTPAPLPARDPDAARVVRQFVAGC